jgi:hypothetical protein
MKQVLKDFLANTDETGRFTVTSQRTGIKYFVEPISKTSTAPWGSYNPSTGNIEQKKGFDKYKGAVCLHESLITKENGFDEINLLGPGISPLSVIQQRDNVHYLNGKRPM